MLDGAVRIAYGGARRLAWFEVFAGEKSKAQFDSWLPDDTLAAIRHYLVAIKGPLTTPVGGGFRSLNVALRQQLDLYACVRPVRWFTGVPSPVKDPGAVDMVIFRENTEDIYAGIEYAAYSDGARRADRVPAGRDGRQEHPLSGLERDRHQAGVGGRIEAPDPRGDRVRRRAGPQERHAGAQGQHHEVHRGWLPRLGLPAGARGVRRDRVRGRPVAGAARAAS